MEELRARLGFPLTLPVEPSLHALAAILAGASAYLGPDSGVSQLAAAVGARAVIVYPAATRDHWIPWSSTALTLSMESTPSETEVVAEALVPRLGTSSGDGSRPYGEWLCRSA